MPDLFETLADPHRRALLDVLREGEHSVGALANRLGLPQPSISKQLKTLRDAGLVRSRIDGPRRLYAIDATPLSRLDGWLEAFRPFWLEKLDALSHHLTRSD